MELNIDEITLKCRWSKIQRHFSVSAMAYNAHFVANYVRLFYWKEEIKL